MFLMVPAHPGCPGQNPESHKMVVCVCVCVVLVKIRTLSLYSSVTTLCCKNVRHLTFIDNFNSSFLIPVIFGTVFTE